MIRDLKVNHHTVSISPLVNPQFYLATREISWNEEDNGGPIEVLLRWPKSSKEAFEFKTKYLRDALLVPGAFIISTLPVVYEYQSGERATIQLHFREIQSVEVRTSIYSDFPSYNLEVVAKAVKLVVQQQAGNPYVEEGGKEANAGRQTIHT